MKAVPGPRPENEELSFESLTLPAGLARLHLGTPLSLEPLLRATLAEARSAEASQVTVYVGSHQGRATLLAPWLAQTVSLPLRIGEKVLWSMRLAAIRLTPMAQDGVLAEADAHSLLAWLRRSEPSRAVVLTDVSTSAALYTAVLKATELGYMVAKNAPDTHLFHRFRESYASFFSELGSKYRNQLRKKEKVFIERFGSAFVLMEYRRPEEVGTFLDAASAINKKTYQYHMFGESVDSDAASVAAAQRAAQADAFRSFILWHDTVPLCFVLGHQRADGIYEHRQTGYDPAWRDFSPGIVCNMLLLQRLYEVDCPLMLDFGSGDSDYKRLFSNESRVTANPVLIPRLPQYVLAFWLFSATSAVNDAAVLLLDRLGVKQWIKRRLRHVTQKGAP